MYERKGNIMIEQDYKLYGTKILNLKTQISALFNELHKIPQPQKIIILFDEIDALAIDKINSNDLREMGRATSSLLKLINYNYP